MNILITGVNGIVGNEIANLLSNEKKYKLFLLWLFLVIIWNFGAPKAAPIYDVLVAVILSLFLQFLDQTN